MQHLLETAQRGDPAFYKRNLPLPFVFESLGISLVQQASDRLAAVCPFHDDSDPSLHVWQEASGDWKWKCSPCGKGSDVIDLLRFYTPGMPHSEALAHASSLLDMLPADYKPAVEARDRPVLDASVVAAAQIADTTPLWEFLNKKGIDLDPEELRQEWRLGCRGAEVVIPYYSRGPEGDLVAYKHRTADTVALAAAGSNLRSVLYGEWRDTEPGRDVLLCEGESDCWIGADALRTSHVALGLPGAGTLPSPVLVSPLASRSVVLAFDGDDAGREATGRWAKALLAEGCTVSFLPVPEGKDLRSVGTEGVRRLLRSLRPLKPAPDTLRPEGDVYVRPGKEVNTMLSTWRLEPTAELITDEGGTAYAGRLIPGGREVVLTSQDLSSKARIVSWCSRYGVSWLGSDRDAQALLAYLQSVGPLLPSGHMVPTAGLHGDAFIWPGGRAGDSTLVYSPPQFDVHLEDRLSLPDAEFTALQVSTLRDLHRRDVMDPILGWLAAAPLRILLPSFPVLAVTGSSGSGKTTLLQTVTAAFSGADISTNLTSTTKHALASFLACTNAFPVWFDEYRPGARKDTQMALEQLLRDAYTAQISAKGGLGEHWSEISAMQTHAPIIVSGEDTFTETSHTERMVNLTLPSAGKNPETLAAVKAWGPTGLPLAYLRWLAKNLRDETLYLSPQPAGSEDLPSRQRDNLGTVAWGFGLLSQFCQEHGLPALGAPDLSLVEGAGREASQHNPIKDALRWALDEYLDTAGFINTNAAGDTVYLRVASFTAHIERLGIFQLPGRSAAVERYVRDMYGATDDYFAFQGKSVSCISFPHERLLD